EFNFDGLIGPTHNYAGLSFGNIASAKHQNQTSSPRSAALQGLAKMKALADLGIGQAVLPPLRRPRFEFLRELGYRGSNEQLTEQFPTIDPAILATCFSASNMWTANAATVSPSSDCEDGRLHLTAANLSSTLHRSIEHPSTHRLLNFIFSDTRRFAVHPALPSQSGLRDEGAANHTRLCPLDFKNQNDTLDQSSTAPETFPARQTKLASQSIARLHQLKPEDTFFLQQNPAAIDAGVFHNDVISVGNQNVLLCHEFSFVDQENQLQRIRDRFQTKFKQPLHVIEFNGAELPLFAAVSSYFFNSQLVTRPDGGMTIFSPLECEKIRSAQFCIDRLIQEDNPVDQAQFVDLGQSMNNGGGPACLRLRVAMNEAEIAAVHQGILFTDKLHGQLVDWVKRHYRNRLSTADLCDPDLPGEVERSLVELAKIIDSPKEVLLDV
ncbi:UNVERIFIED_CONTAM: hypothetical protein GTU68_024472, partial [Idotea baltica]|nr:hypothetical protein [Idotea baltica]